jgi:hypothetical protein
MPLYKWKQTTLNPWRSYSRLQLSSCLRCLTDYISNLSVVPVSSQAAAAAAALSPLLPLELGPVPPERLPLELGPVPPELLPQLERLLAVVLPLQ